MKKISNKGFTLIELLAVITIMGILMMVAIPAVSRTIENSRRDTFADIAHEYINAVRNAMLADNIECYNLNNANSPWKVASATNTGVYYFPICTDSSDCDAIIVQGVTEPVLTKEQVASSTADLMESGGKSPFGNAELKGYVRLDKQVTTTAGGDLKTTSKYSIILGDTGNHGFSQAISESEIKRSQVLMDLGTAKASNAISGKVTITTQTPSGNSNTGTDTSSTATEVIPLPCKIS